MWPRPTFGGPSCIQYSCSEMRSSDADAMQQFELVLKGPQAPAELMAVVVSNGATAFFVILAMALGFVLPRMLFARFLPSPRGRSDRPLSNSHST
jgi:hypothetical protein